MLLLLVVVDFTMVGFAMVLLVVTVTFTVNTQSSVLGSTDVANKEFGVAFLVYQLDIGREIEGDEDAALLNILEVNNAGITAGERGMNADLSVLVSQVEFDGGGSLCDGYADDGVRLDMMANLALGKEKTRNTKENEDGQEPANGPTDGAPLLFLAIAAGSGTPVATEPAPEAALCWSTNNEFDVGLVGGDSLVDDGVFLVDGVF